MADSISFSHSELPFKYLGLQVGANMRLIRSWDPVIATFNRRLAIWKSSHLSKGGRTTLIKAVLDNLPAYYLSLYKAPISVLQKLEKIRRAFFWGSSDEKKKVHWISWDKICAEKSHGGLGMCSIETINLSLLTKWWWNLKKQPDAFWAKVILSIHRDAPLTGNLIPYNPTFRGDWWGIAKINEVLISKGIYLLQNLDGSWCWTLSSDGLYNTKSMRALLNPSMQVQQETQWNNHLPSKVNIFLWLASQNRIPTKVALVKRNVPLLNSLCPLCQIVEETSDHIFTGCQFTTIVWSVVSQWCGLQSFYLFTVNDIHVINIPGQANSNRTQAARAVLATTCWIIWRMRNQVVFKGNKPDVRSTVQEIKSQSFIWFKNRCKKAWFNWDDWCILT